LKNKTHTSGGTLDPIWLGVFFLILAVTAPWFDVAVSNHVFVKSYVASFGITTLALITLYFKCNNSLVNLKINFIKITLLLLLTLATLSILWSANFDFTVTKWLLWLNAVLAFILALNLPTDKPNLIKIAWGLTIAGGAIAIIGILQHLFDPFALLQAAKPASTFGNKNFATQPLVLIFPLCIFLILSKSVQGSKTWALTALVSFICVYIIYSTTRAVWLSISVEILLITAYFIFDRKSVKQWIEWNNNKRNASIFGIVITLTLIHLSADGFINFWATGSDTFNSVTDSASNTSAPRFLIWQTSLNMIYDAPLLGSGLGTYAHNIANEGYATWIVNNVTRAHNDLLELAVELGLVGIAIFIGVVVTILYSAVKILKNTKEDTKLFYYLLLVALVGSFVNMQFSSPYQLAFPLILFGLYVGLISKQSDTLIKPIKELTLAFSVRYKRSLLAFSFSIIAVLFYFTYFYWISAYSQLNKINTTGNFQKISIVETPIYHGTMHSSLYYLGLGYYNQGSYKQSNIVDGQLIKLWPNHVDILARLAYAEHKLNNNKEALKLTSKLKEIEPEGLYNAYFVEMHVYSSTGDKEKFLKTFHELLSQPEEFLRLNDQTYHTLLGFAPMFDELAQYSPMLYEKHTEYHGYSCRVENNIAVYYFNDGQFEKAAEHIKLAIDDKSKCVNQQLVQLLKNGGVL